LSIATVKQDLLNSLKDREYRAAFNLENVYTTICFQLRALREQREMSQGAFGKTVKPTMAQERISILEDPNADSKPTLNTLLRLAEGLDVGLEVRFVPFSTVLERTTHTNMRELEVDSFEVELPRLEQAVAFEAALQNQANVTSHYGLMLQHLGHTLPARATGFPGSNQAQSPWSVKVSGTVQGKKQLSSELIQGGLANAACVGAAS
jgi:transcriptional regulator with XRE-family HTH domain